jgi:epoxyqueuosine reductase QueG
MGDRSFLHSNRTKEQFQGMENRPDIDHYDQLKKFVLAEGGSLYGVAKTAVVEKWIHSLSPKTINKLDRAISVGFHLSDRVLEDIENGPTKLYFFHYQRANILLDELGLKMTNFIQCRGWEALPIPASQLVDWENQLAHVSHKHVAVAAGLGWIGRNNLLVSPQFGSRLRLITVFTDMPLQADEPMPRGCGNCRACLSSCPSQSIKEKPENFDHIGCYHQIKALVKAAGIRQNICGLCVKACRPQKTFTAENAKNTEK